MKCPVCYYQDTKVIDSRVASDGLSIRRRRECLKCGFRYSTYEEIEILDVLNSSDNFDTVLIQIFSSEEALKEYQEHPDHKKISEIGPPLLSGFSEFDYWK